MQLKNLWAALAVAGLSAACGGGGGGGDSVPADNGTSVSLAGVAAKGVLQFAVVSVHPVKADGSADLATVLATIPTNDKGEYTLPSFNATRGTPYVVRVTSTTDTRELDEVTGVPVALPADFALRALVVAPSTGSAPLTAYVSPFSELAAAAATKATGGITAANATQALSNVRQLLGFDPTTVKPTTIQDASGPEQQTFAVMLTAVSKLANDSGLGCTTGDLGVRTQCVVQALASATTIESTKPGTVGGVDVAATLVQTAQAVVADPVLTAGTTVDAGTINTVATNLQGDGTPATPGNLTAINAATALFTGLRSDFQSLFSQGGATSIATGAANQEAFKFREAMDGVQAPAELLVKDVGAILTGLDMYNDYLAGRGPNGRNRGSADEIANGQSLGSGSMPAVSCQLYTTAVNDVLATTPEEARFIGCSAQYYVTRVAINGGIETTRWRHGFSIEPGANGSFTYSTRPRRTVQTCTTTCTQTANVALLTSVTGAGSTTLTNGRITAFSMQGDLAGAFKSGTNELANQKTTVDLTGTRTIDAQNMSSSTFSGTAKSYDANAVLLGTLKVNSGSTSEIPVSWDANDNLVARNAPTAVDPAGGDLATGSLDILWTTPSAEFAGSFALTDSSWDKSLTSHIPTKVTLSGSLRNITDTGATEFLTGTLTAAVTGYANYTANAVNADTAANFFTTSVSFAGSVTAPTRPKLELTVNTAQGSHEDGPASVTMQYRSLVAGTPKLVIGIVATRQADGSYTTKLTEAASNLSMTWAKGATEADLLLNGTEVVAKLSSQTKVLTFTDGTFISLDIGL
ncbi:hypothetical protein [Rhizobacter sp. Root1221]|uniref:hypothetical protein n=1 Tax=Rhizobacter sp. Root1221 TaxID=1736433 RepID=UPI0006F92484|nr:hypothetical protein [Rhizobacter sp. Root1221]KQV99565.1 hypothetical protein ASC87_02375 [Rhizobacter sp. Root1221]